MHSRAMPARLRSPWNRASGEPLDSDAHATSGSGSRSAGWPTAAVTGIPGPRISTRKPVNAATTTPARSGPSDAPGVACSGSAGATTPRTTRPATARCNNTSRSPSPPPPTRSPTMKRPNASQDPVSGDRTSLRPRPVPDNPRSSSHGRRSTQDVFGDAPIVRPGIAVARVRAEPSLWFLWFLLLLWVIVFNLLVGETSCRRLVDRRGWARF